LGEQTVAKGEASDPAWGYITKALERAAAFAQSKGYTWSGPSNYYVSALTLDLVMATRNGRAKWMDGQPPMDTANRGDINLAYADHYLTMRGEAARVGYPGAPFLWAKLKGYDAIKEGVYALKDLPTDIPSFTANPFSPTAVLPDWALLGMTVRGLVNEIPHRIGASVEYQMRENKAASLSRPDELSQYWAIEGVKDGLDDWQNNKDLPGVPAWRSKPF
jgi:hypothetical protein